MNRRDFLKASAALVAWSTLPASGLLIPSAASASVDTRDFWTRDRTLWVRRPATGEEFRVVYWTASHGVDIPNYIRLCYLLRDVEEDETVMMDVNLLNLMYGLQYWNDLEVGHPTPYVATSGQRMPNHNARVEGAAHNSLHQYARAVDGHIPGVSPRLLASRAEFFGMGGVGVYDVHTHIDTGKVRKWDGSKRRTNNSTTHQLIPSTRR